MNLFDEIRNLEDSRDFTIEECLFIAHTISHQLYGCNLDAEERFYLIKSIDSLCEKLKKIDFGEKPVQIFLSKQKNAIN